jgi:hypothetical protein
MEQVKHIYHIKNRIYANKGNISANTRKQDYIYYILNNTHSNFFDSYTLLEALRIFTLIQRPDLHGDTDNKSG